MKYLRLLLAVLSIAAMTLTFVLPTTLVTLAYGWLPGVQLVPAILTLSTVTIIILAISVFLFGRLYCSVVCPLGIVQDFSRFLFNLLHLARHDGSKHNVKILRLTVLALFVVGSLFGLVGFIEPYGIFGRALSALVGENSRWASLSGVWATGLALAILAATAFRSRWWCNTICPVGAFLSLFSKFAVFRVRIDREKCVGCGQCARSCDKGAIAMRDGKAEFDPSSCVTCFNCRGRCSGNALKWR